jgi:cell division protease FtsH
LNKKAFQQIIEKELNSFRKMAIEKFPKKITDVSFSDNIKELIYKEGVFPVIGARSVFSTVNEIISDKFTYVIKKMIELKKEKEVKISFDYNKRKKSININFYNSKNGLIGNENIRYLIKVDGLRTEKDKGKQTHRAVHEAGHAVCSIVLDHIFPEVIYSVVMNAKSSGFNLFNSDDFYYYRKSTYMNRIAGFLAGYAAEEMIFGKDNISNGSSSDIAQATSLLASLFKECGMNGSGILGSYVSTAFATQISDLDYCLIDKDYAIQREIKNSVIKGLELARTTLSEQKLLFLKISEYLSKNPKITNKEIKNLTKKYVSGISMEEINKNKEQFYCDKLNEQLKNLKNNSNE